MSSYANFYLKSKSADWCPIGSYCRSSAVYEYCNAYIPYEKGVAITKPMISDILNDIDYELDRYEPTIKKYDEKKAFIASCNNTMEEKMESLFELNTELSELEEITEGLREARSFFYFLGEMMDSVDYSKVYNPNEYIYGGIEWCPDYNEED